MDIVFLGTGTGIPSVHRGSPSLLVQHNRTSILVDSGPGALRQLAGAGLSFDRLDCLLYTHLHPDHTLDLVSYLFAACNKKAFTRSSPVRIVGPEGFLEFYQHLRRAFGRFVEPPEEIVTVAESLLKNRELDLPDLGISTFPTPHTPESRGYLFRSNPGLSLAVTGDTGYSPELAASFREVDLLVTECSLPDSCRVEGHLTPTLAGRLASEAAAGVLALNHFYPEVEGRDIETRVRQFYKGRLYLTEDLQKITL
ncbi:MAG: MBL fold metallo-hydrolase [Thermodesulfobacteriota bacterium]